MEDCMLAAELGADAVGFVFAEGKRTMTVEDVAAITPHLPGGLEKVGVFSSVDADAIADAVRLSGLTGVQLHSGADAALVDAVRRRLPSVLILPVVHWWVDRPAELQVTAFARSVADVAAHCNHVLVDARTETASGGTGRAWEWASAGEELRGTSAKVVVAGGLSPDNVEDAVRALYPWGVDVSSGVEVSPGAKDAAKMRQFIDKAKGRAA